MNFKINQDFFSFKTLITPKVIQFVYIIFVLVYTLLAILSLILTLINGEFITAILIIILYLPFQILIRLGLELIIVVFEIFDVLKENNRQLSEIKEVLSNKYLQK
ncbi:MAG: DUF4282 domain-containing protein [Ignavibacteria bacterium]|nr:DUF4282 domain-containing protein [Ignavibacteria bacterium]